MTPYQPGLRVFLLFFPGVTGVVDHVDEHDRVWVTLDKNILDCTAGVPTPIATYEMSPLQH